MPLNLQCMVRSKPGGMDWEMLEEFIPFRTVWKSLMKAAAGKIEGISKLQYTSVCFGKLQYTSVCFGKLQYASVNYSKLQYTSVNYSMLEIWHSIHT